MEILDIAHQPVHCGDTVAVVDSNHLVIGIVIKKVPSGLHIIVIFQSYSIYNRYVTLNRDPSTPGNLISNQVLLLQSGLYEDKEDAIKSSALYNHVIKAVKKQDRF